MNIWGYLMTISLWLFFVSFLVGYPVSYFIIGPRLLKKNNLRGVKQTVFWFGNALNIEHDLNSLALKTNDLQVLQLIKLIKYSKFSIIMNLILFIIFAVLNISA